MVPVTPPPGYTLDAAPTVTPPPGYTLEKPAPQHTPAPPITAAQAGQMYESGAGNAPKPGERTTVGQDIAGAILAPAAQSFTSMIPGVGHTVAGPLPPTPNLPTPVSDALHVGGQFLGFALGPAKILGAISAPLRPALIPLLKAAPAQAALRAIGPVAGRLLSGTAMAAGDGLAYSFIHDLTQDFGTVRALARQQGVDAAAKYLAGRAVLTGASWAPWGLGAAAGETALRSWIQAIASGRVTAQNLAAIHSSVGKIEIPTATREPGDLQPPPAPMAVAEAAAARPTTGPAPMRVPERPVDQTPIFTGKALKRARPAPMAAPTPPAVESIGGPVAPATEASVTDVGQPGKPVIPASAVDRAALANTGAIRLRYSNLTAAQRSTLLNNALDAGFPFPPSTVNPASKGTRRVVDWQRLPDPVGQQALDWALTGHVPAGQSSPLPGVLPSPEIAAPATESLRAAVDAAPATRTRLTQEQIIEATRPLAEALGMATPPRTSVPASPSVLGKLGDQVSQAFKNLGSEGGYLRLGGIAPGSTDLSAGDPIGSAKWVMDANGHVTFIPMNQYHADYGGGSADSVIGTIENGKVVPFVSHNKYATGRASEYVNRVKQAVASAWVNFNNERGSVKLGNDNVTLTLNPRTANYSYEEGAPANPADAQTNVAADEVRLARGRALGARGGLASASDTVSPAIPGKVVVAPTAPEAQEANISRLARVTGTTPGDILNLGNRTTAPATVAGALNVLDRSAASVKTQAQTLLAHPNDPAAKAAFAEGVRRHMTLAAGLADRSTPRAVAIKNLELQIQTNGMAPPDAATALFNRRFNTTALAQDVADSTKPAELLGDTLRNKPLEKYVQATVAAKLWSAHIVTMKTLTDALMTTTNPVRAELAAGVDALHSSLTGAARTRFFDEGGAEITGMVAGHQQATAAFLKGWSGVLRGYFQDESSATTTGGLTGVWTAPMRALDAVTAYVKEINRSGTIYQLALRQAHAEGLEGSALAARAADLTANPTKAMQDAAVRVGQETTMTQQLDNWLRERRGSAMKNPVGRVLLGTQLPFVRVPLNILKTAATLFPPTGAARMAYRAAGGAYADNAGAFADEAAKVLLGAGIMGSAFYAAKSGLLTGDGPADPKARAAQIAAGWRPGSFHVGGYYVPYAKYFGPFAPLFAQAANLAEGTAAGEDALKLGAREFKGIGNELQNAPFVSQMNMLFTVLQNPSIGGKLAQMAAGFASGMIPIPSLARDVRNVLDPISRETGVSGDIWLSIVNDIKNQIPGLSQTLPARRSVFGEPIQQQAPGVGPGALSFVGPRIAAPVTNFQDTELLRLHLDLPKIATTATLQGTKYTLSNDFRQQLQDEQDAKIRTALDRLMGNPRYADWPDATKVRAIKEWISAVDRGRATRLQQGIRSGAGTVKKP